MPELRQQFGNSSVENLETLSKKISSAKDFPESFIQDVFRQIHTIKGTAQIFGLKKASLIAHELESLLSDVKNKKNTFSKELLLESIEALRRSFDENDAENADDLIGKIKNAASANKTSTKFFPELPKDIVDWLSNPEIESLSAAFGNGKTIFCPEVYFSLTNFREKLLSFREILQQHGEIIATLSAEKKDLQIGFRFLFAGEIDVQNFIEKFSPKIVFEIPAINDNLLETLKQVATHGENLAEQLNKKIEFEIFVAEISLSDKQTKIIFDALLHLIRNAVDHAIEIPIKRIEKGKTETGIIEIRFSREDNDLKITVSDDGKGIDAEKIKLKAIEN